MRLKLIVPITLILMVGLTFVVVTNLAIVRADKRKINETANRQVSDLISRSLLNQISGYTNDLEFIFQSYETNDELKVESKVFPDYLWVSYLNWQGLPVAKWSDGERLSEAGLRESQLLGFRNEVELFEETKNRFGKGQGWIVFNSTVDPFFPTFLLATPIKGVDDEIPTHIVLAEIHAERFFQSINGRQGQTLTLIDSHQNILMSTKKGWSPSEFVFSDEKALDIVKSMKGSEVRHDVLEYKNAENQRTSFYKFQDGDGLTLILQEPTSSFAEGERAIQFRSLLAGLLVIIITINLIILVASRITSPLNRLIKLMEKVGKGEFNGKIKVKSSDEIGRLTKMFNKMIADLKTRDQEINDAKERLVQSEKMGAFGQMSAGIAHEVKNPLAGILGYAQITKKKVPDNPEVQSYLEIIEKETVRCKEIVENLMRFARQEKAEMGRVDINKVVRDSIKLVEHQITISGIKISQVFAAEGVPIWISGNANQLQQVMMNLMLNAQHAMENKGTLSVSTHLDEQHKKLLIMISDTGKGMDDVTKARIFEPFFTTKGVGKGTGLGLSVSLGIIKDHKGEVEVESAVGKGTTFTISIPIKAVQKTDKESDVKPLGSEGSSQESNPKTPAKEEPPKKSGAAKT